MMYCHIEIEVDLLIQNEKTLCSFFLYKISTEAVTVTGGYIQSLKVLFEMQVIQLLYM